MWNDMSLKDAAILSIWITMAVAMIYWYGLKQREKGYREGWAKGYVRGKTVQSERLID